MLSDRKLQNNTGLIKKQNRVLTLDELNSERKFFSSLTQLTHTDILKASLMFDLSPRTIERHWLKYLKEVK